VTSEKASHAGYMVPGIVWLMVDNLFISYMYGVSIPALFSVKKNLCDTVVLR
jgi:hypothetical protein